MSVISAGRLQHWLDTPIGEIYGYPEYGNNIEELLFINRQQAPFVLGLIINKLERDLGRDVASDITSATISIDKSQNDTFYVVLLLRDGIAVGEYNVSK